MASQNLTSVRSPVTLEMIPGWKETICSIEVIAPGLVSEGFLIEPPENLPLVFHGILWGFPSRQGTQGGSFLILPRLMVIIHLLDSLRRHFKVQWFSLWCQTRSSLSSRPKSYLVDHSLNMSSLVSSYPTKSLSTSSKLVGIWDGLLVGFRRPYTSSKFSSWPQIRIFGCLPRDTPLCAPLGWKNGWIGPFMVYHDVF